MALQKIQRDWRFIAGITAVAIATLILGVVEYGSVRGIIGGAGMGLFFFALGGTGARSHRRAWYTLCALGLLALGMAGLLDLEFWALERAKPSPHYLGSPR